MPAELTFVADDVGGVVGVWLAILRSARRPESKIYLLSEI